MGTPSPSIHTHTRHTHYYRYTYINHTHVYTYIHESIHPCIHTLGHVVKKSPSLTVLQTRQEHATNPLNDSHGAYIRHGMDSGTVPAMMEYESPPSPHPPTSIT